MTPTPDPIAAIERAPAVDRFSNSPNANGLGFSNGVVADDDGCYVLHSDYQSLARKASSAEARVSELEREKAGKDAEIARLRDTLTFYATPSIYLPHPHGPAFDRRTNLYFAAKDALSHTASDAQTETELYHNRENGIADGSAPSAKEMSE